MKLNSYEEVKNITKALVEIPSINKEPNGETNIAKYIESFYRELDYFKANPERVLMFKTEDDFVDRHSTMAYVKGTKGDSKKTIIMIGHTDTVGVDDYADLKDLAFKPDELVKEIHKLDISDVVRKDLESGEYMFGRGTLDMKSGVAGHMYLIKYFSEHPEELNGNIVAIHECDEEDNSKGIITALNYLNELREKEGFEYKATINADYSTNYTLEDENRYIYYGSIGKLLPCYVAFGKEAHVGASFQAFDPNLLLAEVTRQISLNPKLCDKVYGEVTLPPISLKQADTKIGYTVQTALVAMSYYNFFTHGRSPSEVLDLSKEIGVSAFNDVVDMLNERYKGYCEQMEVGYNKLPWETRVLTWKEMYEELEREYGDVFKSEIEKYAKELYDSGEEEDLRYFSLKVIEKAWSMMKDRRPLLVIFFGSIFNSRIELNPENPEDKVLIDAVESAVKAVLPDSKRKIVTKMFYPYISDSSFMTLCDTEEEVENLGKNMPAWPVKYRHPVEKIKSIMTPVVNIGTYGKDGHMNTERVDMYHTFQNVPNITYETILNLLG